MAKKSRTKSEAGQKIIFSAVMAAALFFLAAALTISFINQLRQGHTFPAIMGILGAILSCVVGSLLLGDVIRYFRSKKAQKK